MREEAQNVFVHSYTMAYLITRLHNREAVELAVYNDLFGDLQTLNVIRNLWQRFPRRV